MLRQNSGNVPTGTQSDTHVNLKESILRNLRSLGNDRTFQSNKYVGGSVILFIRNLKNSLLVFMKIRENLEKSGNQRNKLSHQFKQFYVGQSIGSIFDRALT